MNLIKVLQLLAISGFLVLMTTACPFVETEGEIKIVNDSSVADSGSGPIVSVNIDKGCSNGWSGEHTTDIQVGGSRTFEVDAGDYDIRACKNNGQGGQSCVIWYDEWVDWDETVTFEYSQREESTFNKEDSC